MERVVWVDLNADSLGFDGAIFALALFVLQSCSRARPKQNIDWHCSSCYQHLGVGYVAADIFLD